MCPCHLTLSPSAKYPLAMVAKALEVLGPRILIGYDIGCSFKTTVASSTLAAQAHAQSLRFCVNAFHGYSHSYSCQVKNHPNIISGMGLEDLETLERVFSSSNQLAAVVRYSSAYRRRLAIDAFFQQWDEDKYSNLGIMLLNNYKQALRILGEESLALEEAKKTLGIQPGDLEKWQDEEAAYVAELGKESDADLVAVAYVELLQQLNELEFVPPRFVPITTNFPDNLDPDLKQHPSDFSIILYPHTRPIYQPLANLKPSDGTHESNTEALSVM